MIILLTTLLCSTVTASDTGGTLNLVFVRAIIHGGAQSTLRLVRT